MPRRGMEQAAVLVRMALEAVMGPLPAEPARRLPVARRAPRSTSRLVATVDQRLGHIPDPLAPSLGLFDIELPSVALTECEHLDASGDAGVPLPLGTAQTLTQQGVVVEGDPRRAD